MNSRINPYEEYFSHTVLKHQYHLLQIRTEHYHSNYKRIFLVSNLLQYFTGVNKVSSSSGYNDVQYGDHICTCSPVKCFTVPVCTTVQRVFTVHDLYYWEYLSWIVGYLSTEDKNSTSLITNQSCISVSCVCYIYRTFLFSAAFQMTTDSTARRKF